MDDYKQIAVYFFLGVLATWGRLLLAIEKVTVHQWLRTSVTGAFIGMVIGLGLLEDSSLSPWMKYAIFGIAVSLAEDICIGILHVGQKVRTDPESIIRMFWRK